MENRSDTPTPVPNPSPLKSRDYQPPETTSQPQPVDDPAAGPRPPFDFDPAGDPPESGKPQH